MTTMTHTEWLRWAANHTDAELASALATIEWLKSRPCAIEVLPLCATADGIHYLNQERANRAADARIAARADRLAA